jgi:hypothetical protein
MILPSDSDLPPERDDAPEPAETPEAESTWWNDPAAADEEADLEGDAEATDGLQSIAGPGWRDDLRADLLESLGELAAIEDPEDEFAPPEPPDLFTFYGELAALRHELRHQGQKSNDGLNQLSKSLAPLLRAVPSEKASKASSATSRPAPWPLEHCLALLSVWDMLPQASAAAACEASLHSLLQAAGLAKVATVGQPFDAATMTLAGSEAQPGQPPGRVLRETVTGFLRSGLLLRPASVVVAA